LDKKLCDTCNNKLNVIASYRLSFA
jgi:hypothetical protein